MNPQQHDLRELLDALDIEAWLDSQGVDYVATRGRSGRQLNVKTCPTCGSSDGKVYLNSETGLGNCFGGSHPPGETFNKWKFIRATLNDISGAQVVEHIAHHVGARGWVQKRDPAKKDPAPELILPASFELPHNGQNLQYLLDRGVTDKIARYFQLRYCFDGGFAYLLDGERKWMKFNGRVIVPLHDLEGKLVNFQGRDITGTSPRKYLFPPGLPSTGCHLLNAQNVRDTSRIVMGEGAFDVMALKLALDEDPATVSVIPVGSFGKKLSMGPGDTQEAKLLALKDRGVREVTFMWDGETAATDSAIDAGMQVKKLGLQVRVGMLPKDTDPNEVPGSVVRQVFHDAMPLTMTSAILLKDKRRRMNAVRSYTK